MDNNHDGWIHGHFVDCSSYRNWTTAEKIKAEFEESFLVRPYPTGNALCRCSSPEVAEWISNRLNLCARLEKKIKELNRDI